MEDSKDVYFVAQNLVHQPVAVYEDLANRFFSDLRNHSASFRMLGE